LDDLHVDGKLASIVTDDKDSNAATTTLKGLRETVPQIGLVNDGNSLLDITSLGHSDNSAILEIKDTVLLEDGAKHGLDDNTWAWVGNEWRLLVQLLGEKIDTQVSVLASGTWGRDTDDLARTTLKDQEITSTDVVAGNGDSVGDGSLWSWGSITSTILIVVTHVDRLEGCGRFDGLLGDTNLFASNGLRVTGRLDGLFNNANGFTFSLFELTGRIDGLFSDTDLWTLGLLEAGRWVNGGTGNTNFFAVGWDVAWRINGWLAVLDFLTEGLWLESGWVYSRLVDTDVLADGWLSVTGRGVDSCLVDANFFTVSGLEAWSVFTFVDIDLSLVLGGGLLWLAATGLFNLDVYLSIVSRTVVWEDIREMGSVWKEVGEMGSVDVWKLNVDASWGLFDRSHSLLANSDIFSAARTVVTFFLASDMNFLLLLIILLVLRRKSGRERRGLTFPSDALLSW
jgi:hypothetical protein